MLSKDITKLIGEALKAGDRTRLETLKMLSSAFNYERIELQHELTNEEELNVIRKQAKQRRDSIEAYDKAGRADLSESENKELMILQEFLPPEMDEAELNKIIDEAIVSTGAKSMSEMGKVIGMVKSKAPNVDGGRIAAVVKGKLS